MNQERSANKKKEDAPEAEAKQSRQGERRGEEKTISSRSLRTAPLKEIAYADEDSVCKRKIKDWLNKSIRERQRQSVISEDERKIKKIPRSEEYDELNLALRKAMEAEERQEQLIKEECDRLKEVGTAHIMRGLRQFRLAVDNTFKQLTMGDEEEKVLEVFDDLKNKAAEYKLMRDKAKQDKNRIIENIKELVKSSQRDSRARRSQEIKGTPNPLTQAGPSGRGETRQETDTQRQSIRPKPECTFCEGPHKSDECLVLAYLLKSRSE